MIGVGVDFGTSNSAVATFDGETVELVQLEADGPITPTATYIDRGFHTKTGNEAIRQYIEDNTGRTVELAPELIGRATVLVSERNPGSREAAETLTQDVYSQSSFIDLGLRGRLFRGVKRLLGDKDMRRLMVFDHPYRLVALITPVLLRMQQTTAMMVGARAVAANIGHPVNFEGKDPHRNKLALSRLGEACRYAGFVEKTFYPEPVAATLSYLNGPVSDTEVAVTVDFGGGTLDLCVLRVRGTAYDVLATHGVALGGDHIDQRMFRELLFPLLGKAKIWRRKGHDRMIETRFPFEDYEGLLLNWAMTYNLNQNRFRTPVTDCIEQGGEGADQFRRLRDLVEQNYGYVAFQALKEAKARLSSQEETVLDIPEIDVEITVTRVRFEEMIADMLARVEQAILKVLELAHIGERDVDVVVRTGGSSLIPAVTRIVEDHFPGRVVEHDPFTSVAAGLAIANYHGYTFDGV